MLPGDELISKLSELEIVELYRVLPTAFDLASGSIEGGQDAVVQIASEWPTMLGRALLMRGNPSQHNLRHSQKYLRLAIHELAIIKAIARAGLEGLLVEPLPAIRWRRVGRCIQYCDRVERACRSGIKAKTTGDTSHETAALYGYARSALITLTSLVLYKWDCPPVVM